MSWPEQQEQWREHQQLDKKHRCNRGGIADGVDGHGDADVVGVDVGAGHRPDHGFGALARYVFGVDAGQTFAAVIMSALPTAQNVFLFSSRYNRGAALEELEETAKVYLLLHGHSTRPLTPGQAAAAARI